MFVKPKWRHLGVGKQLCTDRRLVMRCDVNPYGAVTAVSGRPVPPGFTDTKATACDVAYNMLVLDARGSDDNDQRGAC